MQRTRSITALGPGARGRWAAALAGAVLLGGMLALTRPQGPDCCASASPGARAWWLFDTTGFVPRWRCGDWSAGVGWLHIGSDLGIWGAYMAIPCVLTYFIYKGRVPIPGIAWLFVAFIALCGLGHLIEVGMFWN